MRTPHDQIQIANELYRRLSALCETTPDVCRPECYAAIRCFNDDRPLQTRLRFVRENLTDAKVLATRAGLMEFGRSIDEADSTAEQLENAIAA